MTFDEPLVEGRFIRRYKRFFVDVNLGEQMVTAHCPNTGSMTGLLNDNEKVWLSRSDNPRRKLAWTWELAQLPQGFMVGVNTHRANQLVEESLTSGLLMSCFPGQVRREFRFEDSRFDFAVQDGKHLTVLEVKSVTLGPSGNRPGIGFFPDAVSVRARKHVEALIRARHQGLRSVLLFCAQHTGIRAVAPAVHIDPCYGRLLNEASHSGVIIMAVSCELTPLAIRIDRQVPVEMSSI